MRWWKSSLAGRFIVFILAALFVGQAIGFLISTQQREAAIRQTIQSDFINRSAALSAVLDLVPPEARQTILIASSTGYARFWLSAEAPTRETATWSATAESYLNRAVIDLIRSSESNAGEPGTRTDQNISLHPDSAGWHVFEGDATLADARLLYLNGSDGMGIVGRLDDGTWMNAVYYKPSHSNPWTSQSLLSVGITAAVLSLIGVFVARQIARPLQQLTASAEALGRGETLPIAPPSGPDDVRKLYEAFERMQMRLRRFLNDQTRMFAAIGHDLRTPLTTLRLRAEFIPDPDLQARMLDTIDEMQAITEATLTFAKNEAAQESTKTVDLTALLDSLCDDLAELGHNVEFRESDRISYRCRPDNIKRAVRNLIENALRYAGKATVAITSLPGTIEISIEDDGPGIPGDEVDRVFEPFYRLENSRSRETGGVGLGLSITRAVARQHGGDVSLTCNNPGLRAVVSLPVE